MQRNMKSQQAKRHISWRAELPLLAARTPFRTTPTLTLGMDLGCRDGAGLTTATAERAAHCACRCYSRLEAVRRPLNFFPNRYRRQLTEQDQGIAASVRDRRVPASRGVCDAHRRRARWLGWQGKLELLDSYRAQDVRILRWTVSISWEHAQFAACCCGQAYGHGQKQGRQGESSRHVCRCFAVLSLVRTLITKGVVF